MSSLRIGIFAFLGGVVLFAHDGMANEADFSYKNWDLVCDNTRTCRAAGYSSADDENLSTMLLTREAGPNTPVSMELQLHAGEDESGPSEARLKIGGLVLANIAIEKELPQKIAAKLLSVMPNEEKMTLTAGDKQWTLSLAGLKAVLLKMDDKQGRVGTPGALIAKGTKSEKQVLPSILMKTLTVPIIPPTRNEDENIFAALKNFFDDECKKNVYNDCGNFGTYREAHRLSADKMLVKQLSSRGPYNELFSFWVVSSLPPYKIISEEPILATDYGDGVIYSSLKGRGIGDCWSLASWAWTGEFFEKASESSSFRCVGVAGGAWNLPTFVSKVVKKNEKAEQ